MPTDRALRDNLADQVRANVGTVSAGVLAALRAVPRHLFLPGEPVEAAYRDEAIVTKRDRDGAPISSSSQPSMMALMLDQLSPEPGHRVLEIGAGTGYNAALIAELVSPGGEVVSIDIDADLVRRAREHLAAASRPEVRVECADGAEGFADRGPYDRIIATVGVWDLAPAWLGQLAPDGRLVAPVDLGGVQRSVAFVRDEGHWASRSVVPCGFMRLRGSRAGPERTAVLSSDDELSIMMPNGGAPPFGAVLEALDGQPAVRSTGAVIDPDQIFTDLGLWLAVHEPRWCMASEAEASAGQRLSAAPLTIQHLRFTAGLLGAGGLALLAGPPSGSARPHMLVHGFGAGAGELADQLAAHVTAWDRAGRPGEGLRISAYPKASETGETPDAIVLEKSHHRFVLRFTPPPTPP